MSIDVTEMPNNRVKCNEIIKYCKTLDSSYWTDKSKFAVNYGIDGSIGKYETLHFNSIPDDLKVLIQDVLPKNNKYPLNNFMINRYIKDQGFIPMHCDLIETLQFAVVILTETEGDGLSYKDNGNIIKVQDKIGNIITPNALNLIHGIPDPVKEDRYTIISIYK